MAVAEPLGDSIALKIQELRARQSEPRSLIRIDNRAEASEAPFQFDTVEARLHRRGCRAIPSGSRTALYGLWQVQPQAQQHVCTVCRPQTEEDTATAADGVTDYVYGVLSLLEQFGSVIKERGREFRNSEDGRQLTAGLDNLYRGLEERERATLQVVLSSLDGLLATIAELDKSFDGGQRRNGAGPWSRNGDGRNH